MNGWLLEVGDAQKTDIAQAKPGVKVPRKYRVVLINDDYTPMDFVVDVLKYFFHMNEAKAIQIMLEVHHHGLGVCGIYTRDIAETLVTLVNAYAREHQHPLLCRMDPL
jgi:ATP-dependent Clp protease adaptor protein ClpS